MPNDSDWNGTLARWMANANYSSWVQLQNAASLSRYRIRQLRHRQLGRWPLQALQNLCVALDISLKELLLAADADDPSIGEQSNEDLSLGNRREPAPPAPSQELQDLHRQAALQILEPLLRQLPTATFAVHHHNLPASHLLKILQPLDSLLAEWDVTALGNVGQVVPYDPTWQSPLTDTEYKRDTPVSIRYVGYRVGRRTWLKAQVRAEI